MSRRGEQVSSALREAIQGVIDRGLQDPRVSGLITVTGVTVGATEDNLKSAIEGETYEYTEMYPGFARTARDEGFEEIAEWLETLARAEKSHAGRFTQGLETVD